MNECEATKEQFFCWFEVFQLIISSRIHLISLSFLDFLVLQLFWITMSGGPERYLCWRWEDESEEHRLTYQPDGKKPNAATFILHKEDHTLGNLIRIQLLRVPDVRFAGYRMPHPLIFDTHIRVETMDSKKNPKTVRGLIPLFIIAVDSLLLSLNNLGFVSSSPRLANGDSDFRKVVGQCCA